MVQTSLSVSFWLADGLQLNDGPVSLTLVKAGDYSLKIHKSAYNLFSVFISKRGFSLQTKKSFAEIFSGNHRFLRPGIRLDNKLHILTQQKYCLSTTRLLRTYNRLALLLPMPLGPIMAEITNASAFKLPILV